MKYVQHFPDVLWITPDRKPLPKEQQKMIHLFYWKDGVRIDNYTSFKTVNAVLEYIEQCDKNNVAAFAAAFVEEDNQLEVIAYSPHGKLEWLKYLNTDKVRGYRESIERAKRLALGFQVITK